MKYHLAEKHSKATARVVHKCNICDKHFPSFYLLREHKRKEQGAHREIIEPKLSMLHNQEETLTTIAWKNI